MFKKTKVCTGLLLAFGSVLAVSSLPAAAQTVEITGSRIKRVDVEGSLPVTTISRAEIEASGTTTVAEFLRTVTFASAGNFRPQSGSSAQSWAAVDLRGLGSNRTLALIDGRRLPKAPMQGQSADLNSIPMAAIDRIEILTDGASAIYGSDAIGGVINFITRKDFEGVGLMAGYTNPENAGGERKEGSAIIGMSGDKGRILGGFSRTERGMVFTAQRPWGQTLGVSSFGNNYRRTDGVAPTAFTAVPGACTEANFWLTAQGTCSFNFNAVAADEAQVKNTSVFLRGESRIGKDWSAYINTSVSRVESFGRYAPTPGQVTVAADSPNNPTNGAADIILRHRFAAAGNRDTSTDSNLYDFGVGMQGRVANLVDVDFGVRRSDFTYNEFGRNYIVRPLAEQYINSGEYDIYNPSQNDPDILNAIKATINRVAFTKVSEYYANGSFPIAKLGGGSAVLLVGAEHRDEKFQDRYDSLQEAGVIEGSAGNSSGGTRKVDSLFAEALLPINKQLELSLAARYEKYSDYGSDFSPKASVSFKPMPNLRFRASVGQGFRAPTLDILTQKTTFSAESVFDPATCIAFGGDPALCNRNQLVQVDTYFQANPALKSEKSDQYAFGVVWDATPWLSLKADYANIKIKDIINQFTGAEIVDRANGRDSRPIPAGLGLTRGTLGEILRVDSGYANEGTLKAAYLDLNAVISYKLAGKGQFRHDFTWTEVLDYTDGGGQSRGTQGLPKSRATLANSWSMGPFDAALNINYIGKNGSADEETLTKEYVTADIQFSWTPPIKGAKLTLGVVNVSGKMPELIPYDGRNFNFYLYDSYGRQPYVRFTQKF